MDENITIETSEQTESAPQSIDIELPAASFEVEEEPLVEEPKESQPFPRGKAITAMIFGIASIYLGYIPGIVFAIIAQKMSNELLAKFPNASAIGFAKAGRMTGKAGFIVSIVSTALIALIIFLYIFIYIAVIVAAIIGGTNA